MSAAKMKEFSDAVLDVCKSYYADVDDLRAQLAACAAGPWRFDVENAPKDGSEIQVYWHAPGNPKNTHMSFVKWRDVAWRDDAYQFIDSSWFIAFAVPNAPEVTT